MADDRLTRRYTDEEARAVLDRALAHEADSRIGHEELVAAAEEVGITRAAIERAISEMEVSWAEREAQRAIVARRRRGLANHLVPFLAVNAFLFLINWLTTPIYWWFLFLLLPWTLGLFFHAWAALSSDVSARALGRELKRSRRQPRLPGRESFRDEHRARERERHGRLAESVSTFGDAAEESVALLLQKLAQELPRDGHAQRGPRVKQGPAGRVRVDGEDSEPPPDEPPEGQSEVQPPRHRPD